MKTALIFGVTGMDGSYLADLLLTKDYTVFGVVRGDATESRSNTKHLEGKITFLNGDLMNQDSLISCLQKSNPDEVYNLAGQSSVFESWKSPQYNGNVNAIGTLRLLDAIRAYGKPIRFFQASTSEMFGKTPDGTISCNESTAHNPRSPYAISKSYAHSMVALYREAYTMYNCCGILYNHESERRGMNFITRKITHNVAKIHLGLADSITLGNTAIEKDWGYAPDYMEACWLMLQQDKPDDYIIATEQTYSLDDFLRIAFQYIDIRDYKKYIKQDQNLFRPVEFKFTPADCSKAKQVLKWKYKTSLSDMIAKMVQHDIDIIKQAKAV